MFNNIKLNRFIGQTASILLACAAAMPCLAQIGNTRTALYLDST
jgi:hypothetical protein